MSYILDALRRADAERERERGAVPGLHAQAAPLSPDEVPARPVLPWPLIGAAAALLLVLALVLWWWLTPPAAEAVVEAPPAAPPVAMAPAVATPAAPAAPMEPVAVPSAPVMPAAPKVTATPTRPAARPAPAEAPDTASPAPTRVASVADLPAEVRSALPGLNFGGSIYSATPANRLLIVNGQLLHEGDSLGGGATLEQIKPKAAVLRVQGQRFEVGF